MELPDIYEKTPEQFFRWLTNCSEGSIVGWSVSSSSCPIANWLKDAFPSWEFGVDCLNIQLEHENDSNIYPFLSTPVWMDRFIAEVDRIFGPVKREQALQIFHKLYPSTTQTYFDEVEDSAYEYVIERSGKELVPA